MEGTNSHQIQSTKTHKRNLFRNCAHQVRTGFRGAWERTSLSDSPLIISEWMFWFFNDNDSTSICLVEKTLTNSFWCTTRYFCSGFGSHVSWEPKSGKSKVFDIFAGLILIKTQNPTPNCLWMEGKSREIREWRKTQLFLGLARLSFILWSTSVGKCDRIMPKLSADIRAFIPPSFPTACYRRRRRPLEKIHVTSPPPFLSAEPITRGPGSHGGPDIRWLCLFLECYQGRLRSFCRSNFLGAELKKSDGNADSHKISAFAFLKHFEVSKNIKLSGMDRMGTPEIW